MSFPFPKQSANGPRIGITKYQIQGTNNLFLKVKNTSYQTSGGSENNKPWTAGRAGELTERKSEIGSLQIDETFWQDIPKTIKFS